MTGYGKPKEASCHASLVSPSGLSEALTEVGRWYGNSIESPKPPPLDTPIEPHRRISTDTDTLPHATGPVLLDCSLALSDSHLGGQAQD